MPIETQMMKARHEIRTHINRALAYLTDAHDCARDNGQENLLRAIEAAIEAAKAAKEKSF